MLGSKINFSSCAIWTGFHKSSHIIYSDSDIIVNNGS